MANKSLTRHRKLESKIAQCSNFPDQTIILKSNTDTRTRPRTITLRPDNVISREMKKYKMQRTKTFIQISRDKTMISPRLRKSSLFPRPSMDLLRQVFKLLLRAQSLIDWF